MSKKICFKCQKAFNINDQSTSRFEMKCPECDGQVLSYTHRFRPPKATDNKRWQVVKFLFDNGFKYQHISVIEPDRHGILRIRNFARYPEKMSDAREFVEAYKNQALR